MKYSDLLILGIALISSSCVSHERFYVPIDPARSNVDLAVARVIAEKAGQEIAAFHAGHRSASNVLRVVYFCPRDADPLPGWQERLNRAIEDISDFYGEGMSRFGFASGGLPLEHKNGQVVLHVVRGSDPAASYGYLSGARTATEIRRTLAGRIDLDREHVLVLYALCRKEPDGRYVFHAPYYGGGDHRMGLCHAADCELLDPQRLRESNRRMVYTEHYYPRMEQTVAQFNSFYLGGVAHELGHGLGLPHDAGSPWEQTNGGASLMADGNLHYREERWGGSKPAFLSFAAALQLASHPLLTGSNRDRWKSAEARFKGLLVSSEPDALRITGQVIGNVVTYAVIAYLVPAGQKTDHFALTYVAPVCDGRFAIHVTSAPPGAYRLELASFHVNGETTRHRTGIEVVGGPQKVQSLK